MDIMGTVQKHPYLTAAGVFAVGLILVLMFSAGDSAEQVDNTPAGTDTSSYAAYAAQANMANAQLSQQQISAQVASRQVDAELQKTLSDNSTAFKIAEAQFQSVNTANNLAATTAAAGYEASKVAALANADVAKTESNNKYRSVETEANFRYGAQTAESVLKYAYMTDVDENATYVAVRNSDNTAAVGMNNSNNAAAVAIRGYQSADLAVTTQGHSVDLQTEAAKIANLARINSDTTIALSDDALARYGIMKDYTLDRATLATNAAQNALELRHEAQQASLDRKFDYAKLASDAELARLRIANAGKKTTTTTTKKTDLPSTKTWYAVVDTPASGQK